MKCKNTKNGRNRSNVGFGVFAFYTNLFLNLINVFVYYTNAFVNYRNTNIYLRTSS